LRILKPFISLVVLFSFWQPVIGAPNPVQMQCVTVNDDNSVSINWSESNLNQASFNSYSLYVDNFSNGTFTLLATINDKTITSYTHVLANATINKVGYYVVVSSTDATDNVSLNSDKVSTIFLEVQNPTGEGVAKLFWRGNTNESTEIQKMYPNAGWSNLKNITPGKTNYSDTIINICQAELGYRVSQTIGGCVSYSNQVFDDFTNEQAPTTPVVNLVTVNHINKSAVISWKKPPEIDTHGYLVMYYNKNENGIFLRTDSVKDPNQLSYEHVATGVYDSSVTYQIVAYDNCRHIIYGDTLVANSSTTLNIDHRSIYLTADFVNCSDEINFAWNSYIYWQPSVTAYQLMIKNNTKNTLDSVAFSAGQENYQYTLSGLPLGDDYTIWIKATNGVFVSLSNDINFLLQNVVNPSEPFFVGIDARSESEWVINGYVENRKEANKAILQRYLATWSTVKTNNNLLSNELLFYYQNTFEDSINTFRLGVINACGTDTIFSAPFQNIWLSGEADESKVENLIVWNFHEFWVDKPQEYQIFRQDPLSEQFIFKESLVNTRNNYIDEVIDETNVPGTFCYYIQAIESQNGLGLQGKSFSNVKCVNQPHQLYIPSAFKVNGYSLLFKPKGVFLAIDNYEFTIVDRWGKTMFFADNLSEGWDGKVNGALVPQGVYVYSIGYQDAKGQYYFKTGTVTLLK
jgi:gliding motility-associated-like protein